VNGTVEDNQLRFKRCDRDDAEQRWIFYDACPPGNPLYTQPWSSFMILAFLL